MDKSIGDTYFDIIENETQETNRKLHELIDSYHTINEQLMNLIEKKSVFDTSSRLMLSQIESQNIPKKNVNDINDSTPIAQILNFENKKQFFLQLLIDNKTKLSR